MSIKVSTWVWEHSKHRGTLKLLILALADFANDSGICWPSVDTLSKRIGESERHTRQLIKQLVEAGDLLVVAGGGRGNTTKYAVAVGLSDKQKTKLNNALQNSVSQNSDHQKTVISGDENSDLQRQETLRSGDPVESPPSAPETPKVAVSSEEIRHVDPSLDPTVATQPADTDKTDHQKLMKAYGEWLGYKIPHGAKEAAAAKKILQAGYTIPQADRCYHALKSQAFYGEKHVSLQTVYEQIGALLTAPQEHSNGRHEEKRNGVVSGGAGGESSGDAANAAALERSGQRPERAPLRRATIDW